MPRAKIPYPEIDFAIEQKYPYPLYKLARLIRPSRYNDVKAPVAVYDRTSGNYKRIGFRCLIVVEQFVGIEESTYQGYRTVYDRKTFEDIIEI